MSHVYHLAYTARARAFLHSPGNYSEPLAVPSRFSGSVGFLACEPHGLAYNARARVLCHPQYQRRHVVMGAKSNPQLWPFLISKLRWVPRVSASGLACKARARVRLCISHNTSVTMLFWKLNGNLCGDRFDFPCDSYVFCLGLACDFYVHGM